MTRSVFPTRTLCVLEAPCVFVHGESSIPRTQLKGVAQRSRKALSHRSQLVAVAVAAGRLVMEGVEQLEVREQQLQL